MSPGWKMYFACLCWNENSLFVIMKAIFCWIWRASAIAKENLCWETLQISLQFKNSICHWWKLHYVLKIAIFRNQNSIMSWKCAGSLFKMKQYSRLKNQFWAKWKENFDWKRWSAKMKILFKPKRRVEEDGNIADLSP